MSEFKHTPGYEVTRDGKGVCAMSSFTPGPWRYVRENGSPTTGPHMINGAIPGYLAEVRDCGSGDVAANASLIAAAPELLEALEASHAEVVRLRDAMFRVYATAANGADPTTSIEKMRDAMDAPWSGDLARAAIAKATGAGHE